MEKKFHVRIKHYAGSYYSVEYSYFYVLKLWKKLYEFHDFGESTTLSGFNTLLFDSAKKAETFAKTLKDIEDVELYQKRQDCVAKEHKIKRERYLLDTVPYYVKEIV